MKEDSRRSTTMLRATFVAVAVVALALTWILVRAREPREREAAPEGSWPAITAPDRGVELLSVAPVEAVPREGRSALQAGTSPEVEAGTATIRGRALLPDGSPCRDGLALAWLGYLPAAEEFVGLRPGDRRASIVSAPIGEDGSFALTSLAAGATYTVSAVTRGAVCAKRLERVVTDGPEVTVALAYTYGLALRLLERGGGPIRTNPLLYGGQRALRGSHAEMNSPRELHALPIEGLRTAHDRHDRWQVVVAGNEDADALDGIELELEVPGYRAVRREVRVPRLVDRLAELTLELEPAGSFGTVTVRLHGSGQVAPLRIEPDRIVGTLHFWRVRERGLTLAVHARALFEREAFTEIPEGKWGVLFQAPDAPYEVHGGEVELGAGTTVLDFDCSDAGTLRLDVVRDGRGYEGRIVVAVAERHSDSAFFAVFEAAPYVVPALYPGAYGIEQIALMERTAATSPR